MSYSTVGCVSPVMSFKTQPNGSGKFLWRIAGLVVWMSNVPQTLRYLDVWSLAGDAVWEVALLDEVCHWQWALSIDSLAPLLFYSVVRSDLLASFSSCLLPCVPPIVMESLLEIISPMNTSFHLFPWLWHFIPAMGKSHFALVCKIPRRTCFLPFLSVYTLTLGRAVSGAW